MFLFLSFLTVLWTFLEASFWWVAPDISISIAYVYYPKHWRRFFCLGLLGSIIGTSVTYYWASHDPNGWLHYVSSMKFHSAKNIEYVGNHILFDPLIIVKGAWGGLPYKLFIGLGAIKGLSLVKLLSLGILSRMVRFAFVLWVTSLIRKCLKSFSNLYPARMSALLLLIWALAITLFDVGINRFLL